MSLRLPQYPKARDLERWGRVLLLLILFTQLTTSAMSKSAAFDELAHLFRSCLIWRYDRGGGTAIHQLVGLFCIQTPELPDLGESPSPGVKDRDKFFEKLNFPIDVLLFPARTVIMWLTVLLGAIVYRWGKTITKGSGGLLALGLLAYDPNILAHGGLVTRDAPAAFTFTLSLYLYQRALSKRGIVSWIAAGISLGFALHSKPYAPILLPVLGLMTVTWDMHKRRWKRLGYQILALTSVFIIATGVQWGLSGFPAQGIPFLSALQPLKSNLATATKVATGGSQQGLSWPAYTLGQRSFEGWPFYFPLLILVKTPLPLLTGALASTVWLIKQKKWRLLASLSLPLWMLVGFSRLSLNIGYRHLLPAVPSLALLSAYALDTLMRRGQRYSWIASALLLWFGISSLHIYPDYLAYFNEVAGGPRGGIHFFTDSNLDWGQDLKGLKRWLDKHDVEQSYLSYFGGIGPGAYGINSQPLVPRSEAAPDAGFAYIAPSPGTYAISVTNLTGQYLWNNPTLFSWFWPYHSPIARIGHSIWVFQVPPDPKPPRWAAVCLPPHLPSMHVLDDNPPLDLVQELQFGIDGSETLRLVPFDCSRGWPLAREAGDVWLLIPSLDGRNPLNLPPAGDVEPVYRQENYPGDLLFTVFRWKPPQSLPYATFSTSPTLGDVLRLEKTNFSPATVRPGETLTLTLVWQVLQIPPQPISFMAHLWDTAGQPLAVDDGNAIPPEHWQPGDQLVQIHRLPLPPETKAGRYTLVTGAYIVPEIDFLPAISKDGQNIGETIIVGEVSVHP
ncbi:MAG: glycosyltransferase family 39 protein [Chloroflexota bacterium]|nr:glycosyltransferase family 39 protein [Chloroflexota bacterium]